LFILVGLAFGIGPIIAGSLLAPNRPDSEKLSPYECGFEAFEDARMKFDVRYYLVAILFILLTWKSLFFFRGPLCWKKSGWRGLPHDGFPWHSGGRLHLRMDEGALEWE